VVRESYPDHTAWDSSGKYYDAKSPEDNPRWFMVDWQLVRKTKTQITLEELKRHKDGVLKDMALFTTARLSVQPVAKEQWEFVLGLEVCHKN
jgi:predicted RNA-binding protein with PUA-like domain